MQPNSVLIDHSTNLPSLAEKMYHEGKKYKIEVLDAPVAGGDVGAREGKLAIMVGGKKSVF